MTLSEQGEALGGLRFRRPRGEELGAAHDGAEGDSGIRGSGPNPRSDMERPVNGFVTVMW